MTMNVGREGQVTQGEAMLDFVERLKRTDIGRRVVAEANEQRRSERATLAAAYATVATNERAEVEKLLPARMKALADSEKQRAAYNLALARFQAIDKEILNVKVQARTRGDRLERQLSDSADSRIAEALSRLASRLEAMHRAGVTSDVIVTSDVVPARKISRTNARAIGRVMLAARSARQQLEALKLIEDDDLAARIADIERSVPWSDLSMLEPHADGPKAA
jgi:hypothetical protein